GLSWAVAVGAGLLGLLLAAPLAWGARRGGFRPLVAIWAFLLAVPAPLFGIGALTLWNRIAAGQDWAGLPLLLGHAGRFLPLAGLVLATRFRQGDPLPWEAARLVPSRPMVRFGRLFLPLHGSDLFAAATFIAALSFGDVAVSLLLCPPGSQTLALRLFTLLHYGAGADVALQSLMSLACGASAVALLALLLRGRRT
ncbi:MAG: iron ABC transporter permease, partial [Acidobacteriota bacterium]